MTKKYKAPGLNLLAKCWGFKVIPVQHPNWSFHRTVVKEAALAHGIHWDDKDYSSGPASSHAILYKERVLFLDVDDAAKDMQEWLHEVAHLVISPPWEKSIWNTNEMSALFAWERLMADWLVKEGIWKDADRKSLLNVQDTYGISGEEWHELTPGQQKYRLDRMYHNLRTVGLLDTNNNVVWQKPQWGTLKAWPYRQ